MKKTLLTLALITASLSSAFAADIDIRTLLVGKYYLNVNDDMQRKADDIYAKELMNVYMAENNSDKKSNSYHASYQLSSQDYVRREAIYKMRNFYKNLDKQDQLNPIELISDISEFEEGCESFNPQFNVTASCRAIRGAMADAERINSKLALKQKIEAKDFAHAIFELPVLKK